MLDDVMIPESVLRRSYAFERFGAPAAVLDQHGVIVETNQAWRLFAALNAAAADTTGPGANYLRVCDRAYNSGMESAGSVAAGLRGILRGERGSFEHEYPCPSPLEDRWFVLHASTAPVDDGVGVVVFHVDVTAHKLLEECLGPESGRDRVTGLPDRVSAVRLIESRLAHDTIATGALAVIHLRIAGLDAIADDLGTPTADALMVQVTARARRALRADDHFCQWKPHELVILCGEPADPLHTQAICDNTQGIVGRLRDAMAAPFQVGAREIELDVAFGVATAGADSTASALLAAASDAGKLDAPAARRPDRRARAMARPPPTKRTPVHWARAELEPVAPTRARANLPVDPDRALRDAVLARSNEIVIYFEPEGTIAWASPATQAVFGVSADGLVGRNTLDMIHPDDRERAFMELHAIVNLGDHATSEFRIVGDDGAIFWVEETVTNLIDDPNVGYVVGNVRDITERKQHEQSTENDRRRLADAQRSAHLGSFELDFANDTMTCSAELHAILGLDTSAPLSLEVFRDRIHPDDLALVEAVLGRAMKGESDIECTHRVVRPDGTVRWVSARLTLSTDPALPGVSGTLLDITHRKQLELDLLHQATHDSLTGLANRSLLLERLDATLTASDRADTGVLLLDLDRFKVTNDSLGHDRGDQLLVAVADALRDLLEPGELAARFGSDAFAVIVPGLASPAYAYELAERIRARLAAGLIVGTERQLPTISVGIVIAGSGDTGVTALRDAETAMYRAKERGRDRAEWFDPSLHRQVVADFEVERDLRLAIEDGQLYLVFQPVLDLETGKITSCEALLRWYHPKRGKLSPDEFIPIAETTGLIVSVGRWVLHHALAAASAWPDSVDVAVNLSPRELAEPDLIAFVKAALAKFGFPASRLAFEITETAVVEDPTAAARTISALRALGVSVVIDDFGTGYTSLSFLRDYQLDGLKIDRSFVIDLAHGSTAIVDAMIRMSAALGIEVIAEGIETEAQLTALRDLGCRYIQGYLVSQPIASEDLPFMRVPHSGAHRAGRAHAAGAADMALTPSRSRSR